MVGVPARATYNQAACVEVSAASARAAGPKQTQGPGDEEGGGRGGRFG